MGFGDLKQLRQHRFAIGAIAAYLMLLNLLVAALAEIAPPAEDPLQGTSYAFICSEHGIRANSGAPAKSHQHSQECPLCGSACPMGGCAPVPPVAALTPAKLPLLLPVALAFRSRPETARAPSLYPSDRAAQAPPLRA
ncbi:MAG TPA: hypothetical protein VL462_00885 [Candidatus Nitrosotalea sp.]|jgi:hypothetical protein|nr:hypothetical protein [Candidatus Nitrosotalea sp.]